MVYFTREYSKDGVGGTNTTEWSWLDVADEYSTVICQWLKPLAWNSYHLRQSDYVMALIWTYLEDTIVKPLNELFYNLTMECRAAHLFFLQKRSRKLLFRFSETQIGS